MAYATASALIDAVRMQCDWTGGTDTQVLDLLNDGFLRVQREHDFTWQEEIATRTLTTAATGYCRYAQPTDCKEVKALYWIDSSERKELTFIPYWDAIAEFPSPSSGSSTAGPEAWSLFRDEIYLFPSISSAITGEIYYFKFLADFTLTSSNNFLIFGSDALRYATKREYYDLIGESNKAQGQQPLLADAVTSLLKYHTATKQRPQQSTQMRTPGTVTSAKRGGRLRSFQSDRW